MDLNSLGSSTSPWLPNLSAATAFGSFLDRSFTGTSFASPQWRFDRLMLLLGLTPLSALEGSERFELQSVKFAADQDL